MTLMSRDKVMDKIRKLIALSGSSNVHEAEVAAAAAQRLMLEYKIAESEITVESSEDDVVMEMEVYYDLHLKTPPRWHAILLNGVANANFCRLVLTREYTVRGTQRVYQIIGTESDRQAVKYIYQMLHLAVERLCDLYAQMLPFDRADRASFKLGAACSIGARLEREWDAFRTEVRQGGQAHALAVIDKTQGALERFIERRYPHLRTGRPTTVSRKASFDLGREAGETVDVGRGKPALNRGQKGLPA